MTYVQVVNAVLRRMRENQVIDYDDTDYSTLVADFVNDVASDVCAFHWSSLRHLETVSLDGSLVYEVSNTVEASEILRVYNDTQNYSLRASPYEDITAAKLYTTNTSNPEWYREYGIHATNLTRQIEVYPDNSYDTLKVSAWTPQDSFSASSTVVKIPTRPLIYGTWALAIEERGEDAGAAGSRIGSMYQRYLQQAVSRELERRSVGENTWEPV